MSIQELLYQNYLKTLANLKAELAKRDWSEEGNAAYYIAFMECKQAYHLLCEAGVGAVQA